MTFYYIILAPYLSIIKINIIINNEEDFISGAFAALLGRPHRLGLSCEPPQDGPSAASGPAGYSVECSQQ